MFKSAPALLLVVLPLILGTAEVIAGDNYIVPRTQSPASIDALIARKPSLIFNIPEAVEEDEDDEDSLLYYEEADSGVPRPFASEPDFAAGLKRIRGEYRSNYNDDVNLNGVRLKQAKREQVSARLVKKKNLGQRHSPSPSPSPNPASFHKATTSVVVFDKAANIETVKIPRSLPFDLQLFGRSFDGSDLYISPDGYLRLSKEGDISGQDSVDPQALPVETLGDYLLFPYWDTSVLPSSEAKSYPFDITYTFTSTSVTFDWKVTASSNAKPKTLEAGMRHFQLIYHTAKPNEVELYYVEDSNIDAVDGSSAVIGVQWPEGAYQYSSFEKNAIKPGTRVIFDTLSGEVDILA